MVEMRLLEYVLEVYRKQSFTKAAETLCIAQPSLSQQIGKLERELGVTLFYRGRGAVTPTLDGRRFLAQAEQIVRLRDDLEREMRERSEGMGRELVIGAPAITGGHVLPPLLRAFSRAHPQVKVQLVEESTDRLEELAARGLTDLSILALPLQDARLATRVMLTEPLLIALPESPTDFMTDATLSVVREMRGAEMAVLALSECAQAPFILLKQGFGFRQTVLELCAEAGFQPRIAYETSSIESAQTMAAYGLGVTLVPAMVTRRHEHDRPVYARLASAPTRTLVFAYQSDRYLSLAARAFLAVHDRLLADTDDIDQWNQPFPHL